MGSNTSPPAKAPTLATITKRHRAATSGRWELEDDGDTYVISSGASSLARVEHSEVGPPNAQFLANAHADIAYLLGQVRKLTKANRKLRKALNPSKVP